MIQRVAAIVLMRRLMVRGLSSRDCMARGHAGMSPNHTLASDRQREKVLSTVIGEALGISRRFYFLGACMHCMWTSG